MTIQQIVRDILERAIEDGLVAYASPELRFGEKHAREAVGDDDERAWAAVDPQQFTAEELAGCVGLLAEYVRRKVGGKAREETQGDDGSAPAVRP